MKKIVIPVFIFLFFISLSAQNPKTIVLNEDLKIIPVSENVFIHVSNLKFESGNKYPCNGLLYFSNGECLVVDTPTSNELSKKLIEWIKEIKKAKVVGIVSTHWHVDCAGGLNEFHKNNIPSYSLQFTRDTLQIQNLPYPENVFTDSMQVRVGNKFAELLYPGPGHVKDNIVVWFNNERILFGGCLVKSFNASSLGYLNDADINHWDDTLLKVKNKFNEARVVIPGHGSPSGLELIDNSIQMVRSYRNKK